MMLNKLTGATLKVTIGGHSDAGKKPLNQDFHGALIPQETDSALQLKGISLAIADGISSSKVSQIAAETAVKSFLTDYYCTSDAWSVKTAGQRVIWATNSWLHAQTSRHRLSDDMDRGFVCTFTAMVLKARKAHIFHAGDSRLYRVCKGNLDQLTSDHRTILSATESYLARALGLSASLDVEYQTLNLRHGDVFVMTTDGVHDYLSGREIAELVNQSDDLDKAAQTIVETALKNGSDDNLTIQIVKIVALPEEDALSVAHEKDILPAAPIPRVGSDFEGYQIIRSLHSSSRSHIFVAEDLNSKEHVALKVPSIDLRDDQNYLRRFAMEEWVARRLDSAHVLKAAIAPVERETLYVVTELIEGQTLRQWIADNPAPDLEVVREMSEQIAKGLRAFHRKEMVHQDLRPENIMIDRQGTLKIIDFGAVRVAGVLEANPKLDTGEILGTHQYAAPEYFVGEAGHSRSDLYSLGVITYELLTGHLPYGAKMARTTSRRQQARIQYIPLTTYRQDLPLWIDTALRKAVHVVPTERQQLLSEFTHDLRTPHASFLEGGPIPILERNPVLFWKGVSAVFALIIAVLLLWR